MTRFNHYHYFDAASDYTGNSKDYIDSYWSNNASTQDVNWQKLNVPYRLAANIEAIGSAITIEPGTEFLAQPRSGIVILGSGSLTAVGTSANMISFRGEQDVQGYWLGLQFVSNSTSNKFDYVIISNGGEKGFDGAGRKANIEVYGSGYLEITNSEISDSGNHGIGIQSTNGTLIQNNNTFVNNLGDPIFNY